MSEFLLSFRLPFGCCLAGNGGRFDLGPRKSYSCSAFSAL